MDDIYAQIFGYCDLKTLLSIKNVNKNLLTIFYKHKGKYINNMLIDLSKIVLNVYYKNNSVYYKNTKNNSVFFRSDNGTLEFFSELGNTNLKINIGDITYDKGARNNYFVITINKKCIIINCEFDSLSVINRIILQSNGLNYCFNLKEEGDVILDTYFEEYKFDKFILYDILKTTNFNINDIKIIDLIKNKPNDHYIYDIINILQQFAKLFFDNMQYKKSAIFENIPIYLNNLDFKKINKFGGTNFSDKVVKTFISQDKILIMLIYTNPDSYNYLFLHFEDIEVLENKIKFTIGKSKLLFFQNDLSCEYYDHFININNKYVVKDDTIFNLNKNLVHDCYFKVNEIINKFIDNKYGTTYTN